MLVGRPIHFFCFLSLLAISHIAHSQSNGKDSLFAKLKTLPDGEEKVETLLRLSELNRVSNDSLSIDYTQRALQLSKKISYEAGKGNAYEQLANIKRTTNNYPKALQLYDSALEYLQSDQQLATRGSVLNDMGRVEFNRSNYEQSRDYYQQALKIFRQLNDSSGIAQEFTNIGFTYENQGLHSTASNYYFKSLDIYERLGDQDGIAWSYRSIALIFMRQDDFPTAIKYYQKALELSKKMNDEFSVASILTNMGLIYKDQEQYDLAIETQEKALESFNKLDHKRGIVNAQHNLAVAYFKSGDLEQAMRYLRPSLDIAKALNNEFAILANELLLARIYLKRGVLHEATIVANRVYDKTKELGMLQEQHEVSVLLSEIYRANEQPDLAWQMIQKGIVLKDSLYNTQRSQQMQELRTKYETTQKENQIELLNKEKALQESELKRKSLQQTMLLGGVGLFALISFVLFRSYTSRQKQKRALLDEQLKNEKLEAERLHELDEAKSRFFANIAHEFRTPLTLIQGPSEQILQEDKNTRTMEHAQMIQQNADKLLSLTNQLLDLSKLESGMIRLHPARADFITFVKGCVHSFESLAEEKDINIKLTSTCDKLIMGFDQEKTSIIINNLISNAIKFTRPFGEINVSVDEIQLNDEPAVEIAISDTGIGIPEQQLPHIFDRFYQVDDSQTRKAQGTGIGLALTKELVELHRGTIDVSSEQGEGTSFTIRLPISQQDTLSSKDGAVKDLATDGENWAENPIDKKDLSKSSFENKKEEAEHTVLVVEDNPEVRKFIVDILRNFYHVIEAKNGKVGLELTIDQVPDLVISDVMMPEMDGYEYCQKVKEDERTSHIPVIMLTAKAGVDSKVEGLDTGVDDYLAKPFNARELLARINNLIKLRKRLQEKFGQTKDASLFAKMENAFIAKLEKIIDENIDREAFNVEDLGKALAMSRAQLHRKLKALTNLSTSQFIRQYKLEKAVELLRSGGYNVSEVAYMLGFNTPNYFSYCFNEQFGYPPSDVGKVQEKG